MRKYAYASVLGISWLATGCASDGEPGETVAVERDLHSVENVVSFGGVAPRALVDRHGSRWKLIGKARTMDVPIGPDGRPTIDISVQEEDDGSTATPLESETVESLAQKLRSRMEVGGYEYEESEPPLELARAILAGSAARRETAASGDADTFSPEEQQGRIIIEDTDPDDDRGVVRNNTSDPWRTIAQSAVGCTGTLISPTTIITAGHCIYDTTNNVYLNVGGTKPLWGRGADAGDATVYPYGQFTDCYSRFVPQEWIDTSSNGATSGRQWDYGVIKLNCSQTSAHWMGTWTAPEADIEGRTTYVYGYPSDKSPYPQIWGTGVTSVGTYVGSPTSVLMHYIDTTGGQSGSAIYLFNDSQQRRVVGIHRGGVSGENLNVGKRWDSGVFSWVDSKTNFPEDIP